MYPVCLCGSPLHIRGRSMALKKSTIINGKLLIMNKLRLLLNSIIVISTSILIGILAIDKLDGSDSEKLIEISLNSMHITLLFGALLNLIHFIKEKSYLKILLTVLPIILFLVAFIGSNNEFKFSNQSLIIFDFYLIFWFFYLSIIEIEKIKKQKIEL